MSLLSSIGNIIGNAGSKLVSGVTGGIGKLVNAGATALGIPNPLDLINAFSGNAGVQAQYQAIAANQAMNADTNAANLAAVRETNALNYQIWKEQQAQQRQFFDDTNAYNSAAAQMERLRQAGLNPALAMYGGVNAGSAQMATVPQPSPMQAPLVSPYYQDAVDFSGMQSLPSRAMELYSLSQNLPLDLSLKGSQIRKLNADTVVAEQSAQLIAGQYTNEVLRGIDLRLNNEAKTFLQSQPGYLESLVTKSIADGWTAMVKAMYAGDVEQLNYKILGERAHQAAIETFIAGLEKDKAKIEKGIYKQLDETFGDESASVFFNLGRLALMYFMKSK